MGCNKPRSAILTAHLRTLLTHDDLILSLYKIENDVIYNTRTIYISVYMQLLTVPHRIIFNCNSLMKNAHNMLTVFLNVVCANSIPQGRLFEYICTWQQFDELLAAEYVRQTLDVMQYLHNCRIAHLDIKARLVSFHC